MRITLVTYLLSNWNDVMRSRSFRYEKLLEDPEANRAIWATNIQKYLKEEGETLKTAAGKVADQMLDEFLKNTIDANGTEITISIEKTEQAVRITLTDNGTIALGSGAQTQYSWREALKNNSQKKDKLGGAGLGLAISAHFLETQGEGKLSLLPNVDNSKPGARVILESNLKDIGDIDVRPENLNYAHMMVREYEKQENADRDLAEQLLTKFPLKQGETATRAGNQIPSPKPSGDGKKEGPASSTDSVSANSTAKSSAFFGGASTGDSSPFGSNKKPPRFKF